MDVKIGRIVNVSTLEWPGLSSAVIYFGGCRYRCPFCYEKDILDPLTCKDYSVEDVFNQVMEQRQLIEAVTFDGGEATEQEEALIFLAKSFKEEGLKIKLNTNGENAGAVIKMATQNALDYLSLDIKAPLHRKNHYKKLLGGIDPEKVLTGIRQIFEVRPALKFFFECKTTFVPALLHEHDIVKIAQDIGRNCDRYLLQQLDASRAVVDPSVLEEISSEEKLKEIAKKCKPYTKEIAIKTIDGVVESL